MNEIFLYIVGISMLYSVGLIGILTNKRNILMLRMSIELILLGVNMQYIILSVYISDIYGLLIALIVLTVAAAESAIGLAILVVFYRVHGIITIESINSLHG